MTRIFRLSFFLLASALICAPSFPAVQESTDKPLAEEDLLLELGKGLEGEEVTREVLIPASEVVVEEEVEETAEEEAVIEEMVEEEAGVEEALIVEQVIEESAEAEEVVGMDLVVEEDAEGKELPEEASGKDVDSAARESLDKMVAEGELLLELGQAEEARKIFRDVLTLDPENAAARAYLEEIAEELALEPEIIEEMEEGEEIREIAEAEEAEETMMAETGEEDIPSSPRRRIHYFYNRGLEAFEAGNYPEAIHSLEEVQKIDTSYRRADYYRREAWQRIAEDQWAREYMDELALARTMDEMSYDAYARGREFMRYGRYEAAIDEFQKVLDVDPEHQSARELMEEAQLNLEKKSFEEEVAAAELLVDDEIKIRAQAESEERMALRESYHEGERLFREGEFDSSRRKFAEIEEERGRHRRSSFYLRKIDRELWEEKEAERTDFEAEAIRKYTLGPDDVVRVVVRNHPEFDFTSSIEEGGELIIPLTNEIIQADGLTRDDLAETIRQYLTAYIDNPFVNIFITGYGSKKYYVLQPKGGGAEYIMDKASMTLWDVMFRAGIPQLDQAAMRRIQVITPHKTHPTHRWVNVYAMLYQGKMEDNIRIEPGTIIYYPMLAIDKFEMTMKAITRPLKAMVDFQSDYDEFDDWRKEHLK